MMDRKEEIEQKIIRLQGRTLFVDLTEQEQILLKGYNEELNWIKIKEEKMGILLDEYMMLLQTQNGGKVIVDTRPALEAQLKKVVRWLGLPENRLTPSSDLSLIDRQALLKEAKDGDITDTSRNRQNSL